MNPHVKSVKAQDDYQLLLTFENGENRIFDLKPYLDKPVFTKLKNVTLFKTVRVVSGSVEWKGDVDLSYDTLYLGSRAIRETQSGHNTIRGQKKSLPMATIPKKKPSKVRTVLK